MTAILVIVSSWLLNACADAIDHGKGARTLKVLWHLFKDASYALPFGYIALQMDWRLIPITGFLMLGWFPVYRYLRKIDFWVYDDLIKLPWLQWIWNIR